MWKKLLSIIFLFIMMCSVVLANITISNVTTMPEPEPIIITAPIQTYSNELSIQCKDEWNRIMGMQPGENIKRYCNVIDFRIFILLILVFIIWLTEPVLNNKLSYNYKYIGFVYKWLGLGLLFMAGYLLFSRSFV